MWELLERQERLTGNQWKVIAAAITRSRARVISFFLGQFWAGFF